jgi:hypothetical protein
MQSGEVFFNASPERFSSEADSGSREPKGRESGHAQKQN